jgi:dUTP pyrophosphatase
LIEIPVKRQANAAMPEQQKQGDAGADLRALEDVVLTPSMPVLVKTGMSIEIPEGHVGLVCSRSGLALKHGICVLNAPGIVDSGYRGDVGVILMWSGHNGSDGLTHHIKAGERIAQLVITPYTPARYVEAVALSATSRGDGGFGSTGI